MRQKKFFFLIVLFTTLYIYMTNIDKIPEKIVLFQNEEYEINHLKGIEIKGNEVSVIDKIFNKLARVESDNAGDSKIHLSFLGGFFEKDIEVSVLPTTKVILGGDPIGIRLYSKGVLVIGESPVQGIDGSWYEPYASTNIEKGDKILKVNNQNTETIMELVEVLDTIEGNETIIEYEQDGSIYEEKITTAESLDDGKKKLGLWVRDGAMGVGTLTFYDATSGKVSALGHGISDYDLKELIDVDEGFVNLASVLSVTKGLKNSPGEIKGLLDESIKIGEIELNNECGIYGDFNEESNLFREREEVLVASKNEIEIGPATIRCTIDNSNKPQEYDIRIVRVSEMPSVTSRGMVVEVTDEELLNKTGGIIQGMSGSPIMQNGKFIGAITHVYVNDPTRGYAIFAETMIEQLNKINKNEV